MLSWFVPVFRQSPAQNLNFIIIGFSFSYILKGFSLCIHLWDAIDDAYNEI